MTPEPGLIRAPNHLGDLVMALPALEVAGSADVLVAAWLAPLLEPWRAAGREIIPLVKGRRGIFEAARELRRRRYRSGVLLTPSLSSALVLAMGRVARRRGTPTDGRRLLLNDAVDLRPLGKIHRASSYLVLVTGELPNRPPVPHLPLAPRDRERWHELTGPLDAPLVGIFPGSNAFSRRWDAERYAELARRLAAQGVRVAVFGSAAESALTTRVAGRSALDLGGRTDLPMLAAGLAACTLLVTNDSGPMHLAAAVGTRTVSLWGPGDPAVTRPLGERNRLIWGAPIPCVPCVKNVCPRSGRGYVLPDAERECLRLIAVEAVEAVVVEELERSSP